MFKNQHLYSLQSKGPNFSVISDRMKEIIPLSVFHRFDYTDIKVKEELVKTSRIWKEIEQFVESCVSEK